MFSRARFRLFVAWNVHTVVLLVFWFVSALLILLLPVMFLVAVTSLPPRFTRLSLNRSVDVSTLSWMLVSPLSLYFLDTYSLSKLSLGYKALCMIIRFLVPRSICLRSSLVNFNGPEHLTRRTAQVFISFIMFPWYSFVSSCFLVFLRYSF